jgi:hypothetical protein
MDDRPVTVGHLERVIGMLMEQTENRHDAMKAELQTAVSEGVRMGVIALAKDEEFVARFWRKGYEEVAKHGRDDVSRSIGKRVLTWLAGVALTVGIYIAVKAGAIK